MKTKDTIVTIFSVHLTMLERAIAEGGLSVHPSVRLSVTLVIHA